MQVLPLLRVVCIVTTLTYCGSRVVVPEIGMASLTRTLFGVWQNMTNVTGSPSSSAIPDGLVYISTGDVALGSVEDPLFPGLNFSAVLLHRQVEMCQPAAHPSEPAVTGGPSGQWVEESRVRFSGRRPRNFPSSANFSSLPRVGDLTLSPAFLNSSLFAISLKGLTAQDRSDVTAPEFFSTFPDGWYFSPGKGTTESRLSRLSEDGTLDTGSSLAQILIFAISVFLFQGGFFSTSFISRNPFGRDEACRYLVDHCVPGDVRIRHLAFRPKAVSLVAWKNGSLLQPAKINGHQVNIMRQGDRKAQELFEPITESLSEEIHTHVQVALLLALVTIMIMGAWKGEAALLIACAVGLARAIVWNGNIMSVRNWITIVMLSGTAIAYRMKRRAPGNP